MYFYFGNWKVLFIPWWTVVIPDKKNVLTTSKTLCNCKVSTDSSILAEKSYFETTEIISFPKKENHKFRRGSSFS